MATILVIEDNWQNCQLIKTMLEFEGYSVIAVDTVAAAWAVLEEELPDAICCDLMMPGVSGLEFLARRDEIEGLKQVPVIAITGNHLRKGEVQQLGAFAYLHKPFAMSQLLAAVQSALIAERL